MNDIAHKDKLKSFTSGKAYRKGLAEIDWSIGRKEREAERAARKPQETKRPGGIQIMKDIEPFIDPIEGKIIGGNRQKREFMRRHGVIDCGDERMETKKQARPDLKVDIALAIEELGG